jgi:hypothetical protein
MTWGAIRTPVAALLISKPQAMQWGVKHLRKRGSRMSRKALKVANAAMNRDYL